MIDKKSLMHFTIKSVDEVNHTVNLHISAPDASPFFVNAHVNETELLWAAQYLKEAAKMLQELKKGKAVNDEGGDK